VPDSGSVSALTLISNFPVVNFNGLKTTRCLKLALLLSALVLNGTINLLYSQNRQDHLIKNSSGMGIHIRSIKPSKQKPKPTPVLLVHGGGGSGIATFDPGIREYSLSEDLVASGHPVYLVNIRGWANSFRPEAMNEPANKNEPQVNSSQAVEDILAAASWVLKEEKVSKFNLLGWASGGHWAAMFTSLYNDRVNKLILINTMYGVAAPWTLGAASDPENVEAYRLATAEGLTRRWEASIPVENKEEWRDNAIAKAYQRACLESDPTSRDRTPPSVRIPYGYWKEHLEMSRGKKFYEASSIRTPVLLVRSELDFWSRPEDLAAFKTELTNSPRLVTKQISQSTHFIFFDKPEKGRAEFISSVLNFLLE
jgi:pimeloyl-ACP methyl ester carboxylesterase